MKPFSVFAALVLFAGVPFLSAQVTSAGPPSVGPVAITTTSEGTTAGSTALTAATITTGTGTLAAFDSTSGRLVWVQPSGNWAPVDPARYKGPGPSLIQVKNSAVRLSRKQLAPSAYVILARMIGADSQADEATLLDAIDTAGLKVYDEDKVDQYLMREARKQGQYMRWVWKPMRDKDQNALRNIEMTSPSAAFLSGATYSQEIPMQAMVHAKAILDQVPDAVFFVSDYEVRKPDPFLAVTTRGALARGKVWIIDQWNEPGFGEAPQPVKGREPDMKTLEWQIATALN